MAWRIIALALVLTSFMALCVIRSNSFEDLAVVPVDSHSSLQLDSVSTSDSNVVLVSTSDGIVTAVGESGSIWEADLGGPLMRSYQHPRAGLDGEDYSVMLPTTDGSLLVQGSSSLELSPVRAPQLVERTPFLDADQGLLYTGNKKTRVFAVSVANGEVLYSFSPDDEVPAERLAEKGVLYLGRVDYTVHAFQMTHGGRELWNLSYSEIADMSSMPNLGSNEEVPFQTAKSGKELSYGDHVVSEFEHPVTGAFVVGQVFDTEQETMALLRRVPLVHNSDELLSADAEWQVSIEEGPRKSLFGVVMGKGKACRSGQPGWPACSVGAGKLGPSPLHPAGPALPGKQSFTSRLPLVGQDDALTLPTTRSPSLCRPGQVSWPECLKGRHRVSKSPWTPVNDQFELEAFTAHGKDLALGPTKTVLTPRREQSSANKWFLALVLLLVSAGYFFLKQREENILARAKEDADRVLARERQKLESKMKQSEADKYDKQGRLIVGALAVDTGAILGVGSHGTVVFKGALDGRPVAVKRMLRTLHNTSIDREISLLIESDGHQNVVKYYVKEETKDFVYLALQLCSLSMHEAVKALHAAAKENGSSHRPPASLVRCLQQINEGICHLHSLRIVHRDLKPQNILMSSPQFAEAEDAFDDIAVRGASSFDDFTFLISDMGLGKLLLPGESSFGFISLNTTDKHASRKAVSSGSDGSLRHSIVGSVGWQAPEILRFKVDAQKGLVNEVVTPRKNRQTQAVDVFSLGCIFHYVLVPLKHPFGDPYEREQLIVASDEPPKLDELKRWPDAQHLVRWMLHPLPDSRPSACECLSHPFFWTDDTRLEFLVEFSDRIEQEEALSPVSLLLETGAAKVIGRYWDAKLDKALTEDMEKYRKYDRSSLRDCLRVIRNKRHHFNELQPQLRRQLAPLPSAFLAYFESRFPSLLMHCFNVVITALAHEKVFGRYIGEIADRYKRSSSEWKRRQSEAPEASGAQEPMNVDVVVWRDSDMAIQGRYRGWDREVDKWEVPLRKIHPPPNLERGAADLRYRTRLCQYWLDGQGDKCPMRKRNKCDFAHGPVELRVRENKRNRWGRHVDSLGNSSTETASGGEDTYAAACRSSVKPAAKTKDSASNGRRAAKGGDGNSRSPAPRRRLHRLSATQISPSCARSQLAAKGRSRRLVGQT